MIQLSRKALCLDWDPRALRLVVARTSAGQMVLEDAHSHCIPNTVDVESPQSLGEFIQQMLRGHHWHFSRAIVDIPRDKAVINRLTLPPTPVDEVAAVVRFQAIKELPFPLDNAVLDYLVLKQDERGLVTEVLLAAVPVDALAAVRSTCEAAGLEPARIGLRPYANLVSVLHLPGLADQRVLLVDVGPIMTEIDIIVGGQLAFARSASVTVPPLGGAAAGESRSAVPADAGDLQGADDAIEATIRELTVEITRTLQAYRATEPDAQIDQIVIGGGTGCETQLLEAVARRFEVPGTLFDPTEVLRAKPTESVKLRSFSAALGLAWGLSREGLQGIDFLNPKKPIPPRAALKRRLRIGAIVAGVLLAGAVGTDATLYLRQSGEYAKQRARVSKLKKELERYIQIENKVDEVADWQYEAVWPEHLLTLTEKAVEPGKSLLVQQMVLDARTASINMKKVLATHYTVPTEFVHQLNEFSRDGTAPYRATLGAWRKVTGRESRVEGGTKFGGAVDIRVELLDLKRHLEQREARAKARTAKLKGL